MELRLFIEKAAELTKTNRKLALAIGVAPDHLANAKAGRRGLPLKACLALAEILEIDPVLVIWANANRTSNAKPQKHLSSAHYDPAHQQTQQMRLLLANSKSTATQPTDTSDREENLKKLMGLLDLKPDPTDFHGFTPPRTFGR